MEIGIIGGGSLGLLYSYFLSEKHDVCLYVHSQEQKDLIQQEGLTFERNGEVIVKFITVKLFQDWYGHEDVTIIAVKQYHLSSIHEKLSTYSQSDKALLFLQNGMGHVKWFDKMHGEVYVGSVEHGAMKLKANHVIHTGNGATKIANYRNSKVLFSDFVKKINSKVFPFLIEQNYEEMLLKKLVVNAVINPLTAILEVKNGELIHNKYFYQLAYDLFLEIEQSLSLKNGHQYFQNVVAVCEQTAQNRSSMLCDLEDNRLTEIDAILGYILEKAEEIEINTPIAKTFYRSVKGKECTTEG